MEADLSFERVFDGLGVRYVHVSRPPNTYRQESHWGLDQATGHIVSLALTSRPPPAELQSAFYVAEEWTDSSVVLVHQRLLSDPFAPNRFTYTVSDGRLKMVWEVVRAGTGWQMGDYIECDRLVADLAPAPS